MTLDSTRRRAVVHSILPSRLSDEVDEVLARADFTHRRHDGEDAVRAAAQAAADPDAIGLIGPFRSREVAEAVEATAPAGIALLAPVATWAGVTRDDEPGCEDDPAQHRGTVFRLVARDTVVAACIADDVRRAKQQAIVVAGNHEYGIQLDGQLALAGLPRARQEDADIVVLCGLAGEPEIERARSLASLPLVAFDGVQGADLGESRDVHLALPYAPDPDLTTDDLFAGVGQARRAAELTLAVAASGGRDRRSFLDGLRALGSFDEHGDPVNPPVWLWRAGADWSLTAERPLAPAP